MKVRKSNLNKKEKSDAGIVSRRQKIASDFNKMKVALKGASGVEISDEACGYCIKAAFKSVFGKEEYTKIVGRGVEDIESGYISEDSVRRVVEAAIARRR
jgi:hypothetical protein